MEDAEPCSPREHLTGPTSRLAPTQTMSSVGSESLSPVVVSRVSSFCEASEPLKSPTAKTAPHRTGGGNGGEGYRGTQPDQLLLTLLLCLLFLFTMTIVVALGALLVGQHCSSSIPLLEPDVRTLNWDQVWKAELNGIATDQAGWVRSRNDILLESLGKGEYQGPPKIAFMFLTRGPMPLIPLWERFLADFKDRASIYIHASTPGYNVSDVIGNHSLFHGRQIPGVQVKWGGLGMVRAERELITAALEDPANQRFVLLSESCIPIRSFAYVADYLFASNKSFITSHQTDWRYPGRKMASMIPRSKFRKGSQWIALTRKHAELVSKDHTYFASFAEAAASIPDESYIQTLVPMLDPEGVEARSVSFVQWPSVFARHPITFPHDGITGQLIREIQSKENPTEETVDCLWRMSRSPPCELNGQPAPCFLFARKFDQEGLPKLMDLKDHLGY